MPSVTDVRERVRGWLQRKPKVVVPRTILIVDGNAANRQSSGRLVESLGYRALQAPSLAEALDQFEADEPEFVLLGFDLDDTNGLDALAQLREQNATVPVIMLAANLWDTRAAEAMRRGAVAYLARPYGPDELREVLGRR